jgi:hypothetical protein
VTTSPYNGEQSVAILVCRSCGSSVCDVNNWVDNTLLTAVIKCYECGTEGKLTGFSVGRGWVSPSVLEDAKKDAPHTPHWSKGRAA